MLARVAEPGRSAIGVPRRARRAAPASRLRPRRAAAAPRVRGVAAARRDRDHALPSRPLGRPRPVGLGARCSARGRRRPARAVGTARGRDTLAQLGSVLGQPDMFESSFDLREYEEGTPFRAAGLDVVAHRVLHYSMLAFGFRVSCTDTVLGYSGDSGPNGGLRQIARDADLFLCEATLERSHPEGEPRGHLAPEEALAARGRCRRETAPAHAPARRAPARPSLRPGLRRSRARGEPAQLALVALRRAPVLHERAHRDRERDEQDQTEDAERHREPGGAERRASGSAAEAPRRQTSTGRRRTRRSAPSSRRASGSRARGSASTRS